MPGRIANGNAADQLLRTIEAHGQIAAWEFDLESHTLYSSPGLLSLFEGQQQPPEDLEELCDRLPVPFNTMLLTALHESLAGNPGFAMDIAIPAGHARFRWLRAMGDAVYHDGKPVRLLGSFQDITEYIETREALINSELRYRAVVEDQTEIVSRHLPDGTFVFASGVYCRFFGVKAEDLLGKHWQPVVHPDDVAHINDELTKLSPDNPVVHIENRVTDGEGRLRWMEFVNRGFFSPDGRLLEMQAVGRDISARRALEEENRVRVEQVTQRRESLGLLAGGIAHDFNNLMTGVLGFASMARFELPQHLPAQGHLNEIERAARRAAELCRQLLAYAGKGRVSTETLDLNTLVEDVVALLKLTISKKAVLHLELAHALPAINGDPTQLRQVLLNLVLNASDATGARSGLIIVSTGLVRASAEYLAEFHGGEPLSEGDYVFLEVRDNGCGMSPETMSQIFSPYYTTKLTGRGLGLSAVLGIVRGHGAGIKVYSELGVGSSFKLLFPIAPGQAVSPIAVKRARLMRFSKPWLVLVADDEETVRAFVARLLESFGLTVLLASNGQEGLQLFGQHAAEISLALLDLTMPRLGGADMLREMHLLRPQLPVVLMSGYNPEELQMRYAGRGFVGYLQKPFSPPELIELLDKLLEQGTESSQIGDSLL